MILTLGLDSIATLTQQLSKALSRNKRLGQELGRKKWAVAGGLPGYCPACVNRLLDQDVLGRPKPLGIKATAAAAHAHARTQGNRQLAVSAPADVTRRLQAYEGIYKSGTGGTGGGGRDAGAQGAYSGRAGQDQGGGGGTASQEDRQALHGVDGSSRRSVLARGQSSESGTSSLTLPDAFPTSQAPSPGSAAGGGGWGLSPESQLPRAWMQQDSPSLGEESGTGRSGERDRGEGTPPPGWWGGAGTAEVLTVVHEDVSPSGGVDSDGSREPPSTGGSMAAVLGDAFVVRFKRNALSFARS